jgi:hypothetical protein
MQRPSSCASYMLQHSDLVVIHYIRPVYRAMHYSPCMEVPGKTWHRLISSLSSHQIRHMHAMFCDHPLPYLRRAMPCN